METIRTLHSEAISDCVARLCVRACTEPTFRRLFPADRRDRCGTLCPRQGCPEPDPEETRRLLPRMGCPFVRIRAWRSCFAEVGQNVHIEGDTLEAAVNAGVARGYTEGWLRKSVRARPHPPWQHRR